jgi:predicted ATP-dependent Lon-type protease
MNLKDSQLDVDNWIKETAFVTSTNDQYGCTEEVGEVARIIARRYGEQSEKEAIKKRFRRRTSGCCFCGFMSRKSNRN